MRPARCGTFITFVALSPMLAAGDDARVPKANGPEPGAVEARLADGSVVRLVLLDESIEVATRYGRLAVPLREVRRIDFGLRFPEGVEKRIGAAVANLGSPDYRQREAASAELLGLRELALPAVQAAVKSADAEVVRRAKDLLQALGERVPAEKRLKPHDAIVTDEFPVVGRVQGAALRARSPHFGEVRLKLADLRSLRALGYGGEADVVVDAARHGLPVENWLDTRVELSEGDKLTVTASGEVDVYPLGGEANTYVCGPKGPKRWGRDPGRPSDPPAGALLGKVGESGKPFLIGESYEGAVAAGGRLYLRIVGSPWQVPAAGKYAVKVRGGAASQ